MYAFKKREKRWRKSWNRLLCKPTEVGGWMGSSRTQPNTSDIVDMEMEVITYNMLKQFLWRHMERHGINNLEQREESFIHHQDSCWFTKVWVFSFEWSPPEQHSVWDCYFPCHLHCHLYPLGPAHREGALLPAEGKWPAEWGSAASASTPSTQSQTGFFLIKWIRHA